MNKKITADKIKRLIPFAILIIAFIFIVLKINMDYSDDVFYKNISYGFLQHMRRYCKRWGSCVLPIAVGYWLVRLPVWIFRISIIVSVVFSAYCISVICKDPKNDTPYKNYIIVLFMLLYPFEQMHTAGWAITFAAYYYPLTLGLYALLYFAYTLRDQKIKPIQYVLFFISLVFACNNIQLCCILLGVHLLFTIYFILQKKVYFFAIVQSALTIAFFIFHLVSPGNAVRKAIDTQMHFPDFAMISTINKVKMGFTTTIANLLSTPNMFFLCFALLLAVAVFFMHKNILYRLMACFPTFCILVFGLVHKESQDFSQITSTNFFVLQNYLSIFFGCVFICSIMLSIYLIFAHTIKTVFIELVFLAGFASRMIMSFSPTIYFSGTRTFIYLYFSLLLCATFIFNTLYNYLKHTTPKNCQQRVKRKTITIFLFSSIGIAILFSFCIYHSYSKPKQINVENHTSKNILFEIESIDKNTFQPNIVTIKGWATKKRQNERLVKTYLALRNTQTQKVYRVNTLLQKKAGLTKKINDHYVHGLGGFISTLNKNALHDKGTYELCILYLSDNSSNFAQTGSFITID